MLILSPPVHPYIRELRLGYEAVEAFPVMACCPACGASEPWAVLAELGQASWPSRIQLVQCVSCDHVFYANPPSGDFIDDFYKHHWNQRRERPGKKSHRAGETQPKIAALAADLGLTDRHMAILEIGCGFGAMLAGLQQAGFDNLQGTEASPYRAAASAERFPGRITAGSYEALSKERKFGLIYANHVAEHISQPRATLEWMRDHLLPDGVAVLLVPDAWAEPVINQLLFLPHLHSFSHRSMAHMAATAGLTAAFWRGATRPNEICLVAVKEAGRSRLQSDRFYQLADSDGDVHKSQRGRISDPLIKAEQHPRVTFALHANEKHKQALFLSGGIGNVGPIGRIWASLFTPLSNLLPDGKLTRKLQKKLGRSRHVTARTVQPRSPIPVIGGEHGTLVFHVK